MFPAESAAVPERIVLVGGGGHCRSAIDVIEATGEYHIRGFLDRDPSLGEILEYPRLGSDEEIASLSSEGLAFCITVGQLESSGVRRRIYGEIEAARGRLPVIVSPLAHVSRHSSLGAGTIVFHRAIVNASCKVGKCCILNTGSLVEHDSAVGDFCHISTGVCINSMVRLGDDVFIGSNATIKQAIRVCSGAVVGAGAVVIHDIDMPGMYVGNPARKVR
jgi:sugar O-acyltransferase (sialic acid O-acetyltransferase NeuD family)